jgi:hypothetical protein
MPFFYQLLALPARTHARRGQNPLQAHALRCFGPLRVITIPAVSPIGMHHAESRRGRVKNLVATPEKLKGYRNSADHRPEVVSPARRRSDPMNRQTLEPKPLRETIDQVFLSPRVLDKAAFEEFTRIIRQLIERAAEDTKSLQLAASQAEAVYKRLSDVAPLIEARLTGAAEAIRALDAKASEVRSSLNKAAECALRAETAQARIDQIARERESQLESSLAAAVQSGKSTLETVKATVEEHGREIGESALRAMEVAAQRLTDIEAQTAARLDAMTEQAGHTIADLEARLNDMATRVANLAGAGLSGITALCDRATTILGYDPAAQDTAPTPRAGSLGDFVTRAELADEFQNRLSRDETSAVWCSAVVERFDPTEPCIGAAASPDESTAGRKAGRRAGRTSKPRRKRPARKSRPGRRRARSR